jgi:hypothetical protein
MNPRRTNLSNNVYELQGGNEDNHLWVEINRDYAGSVTISSVWVPNDEERELIAQGANIKLTLWGAQVPVSMKTTSEPIGKKPS